MPPVYTNCVTVIVESVNTGHIRVTQPPKTGCVLFHSNSEASF